MALAKAAMRYSRRAKPCPRGGKKSFKTKRKARVLAEQLEAVQEIPMYVYRCKNCCLFHLSRQAPNVKEAA
jgi:hypothetical protein